MALSNLTSDWGHAKLCVRVCDKITWSLWPQSAKVFDLTCFWLLVMLRACLFLATVLCGSYTGSSSPVL